MNTKQVIVIRKDLKIRRGKECAQASHVSMAFLISRMKYLSGNYPSYHTIKLSEVEKLWLSTNFRKIVCQVSSETELLNIADCAKKAGLVCHIITDDGLTEFDKPTITCCAIGPDYDEKIDEVTGSLPLY